MKSNQSFYILAISTLQALNLIKVFFKIMICSSLCAREALVSKKKSRRRRSSYVSESKRVNCADRYLIKWFSKNHYVAVSRSGCPQNSKSFNEIIIAMVSSFIWTVQLNHNICYVSATLIVWQTSSCTRHTHSHTLRCKHSRESFT